MTPKSSSLVFLQYLTTVFDNIKDAVLLIGIEPNNTYRLLMANDAFVRHTGHSKDEIGKPMKDITAPSSYKKLVKQYEKVIKTKRPVSYTEWYDVPIGRQVYDVQLLPIFNAVGECVQIAAITRNMTELYTLREQLTKSNQAIEQLAKELRKNS